MFCFKKNWVIYISSTLGFFLTFKSDDIKLQASKLFLKRKTDVEKLI